MEPISVALLAALAGGAGGEAGRQAWTSLSSLVRRPFRRAAETNDPATGSGEAELALLEESPADPTCAQALSAALAARASVDADFETDLRRWRELTVSVRTDQSQVHNEISGGHFSGPVIQGRDFTGLTFTTPPPQASGPETDSTTTHHS
ncbi:hypothetical protein [Streptomyces lincolnensis]|uniref:hypothetical protein n=1 Tax=Streptomyces lincolnensis TaxID=1915 RepID=UPI0037D26FD2